MQFDISKVPDIYDILKYYRLHNSTLNLSGINEVYPLCKALADLVVPQVRASFSPRLDVTMPLKPLMRVYLFPAFTSFCNFV